MAKGFQSDARKNSNTGDVFEKRKDMVRHDVLEGERKERMKRWITFWRRNPHRFIEDYLGVRLYPYQVLMIWMLQKSDLAYIVASRASAKSWLIAVWSLTLGILYPGMKVVICAKTLKQGGIIISEKMNMLRNSHPNVAREIKKLVSNNNEYQVILHNGSSIIVVPSSESARGNRANYIIVEESRLVPREILEFVITPFLEVRSPPYKTKPEYLNKKELMEEGVISYITSAGYKAEYWYDYVKSCILQVAKGDKTYSFIALDYLISVFHNIKTVSMIKKETERMDRSGVQMEYLNIPSGESGESFVQAKMFKRNLKKAFYPQRISTYNPKKNPYDVDRTTGEIRLLSVDVAVRANQINDNTIVSCIRLIPNIKKGYLRQLSYIESFKGVNTVVQAKRVKEIYHDFNGDYIVLDFRNAGASLFDIMTQITPSEERGIELPAMTIAYDFPEFIDDKSFIRN